MGAFLKKQYHWLIAAVVLIQLFVIGGINNNLSGLFIGPVTESLNISRGSFALAISVKSLVSFFSSLVSGLVIRKMGFRRSACIFLISSAVSMVLLSSAKGVVMLAIGAGIHGLSEGVCSTAGATYIVGQWFHKHKGTVLGLVTAATGLGGSVLSILLTGVMDAGGGWQGAYQFCACLLLVLCVLVLLVVRDSPAKLGRLPYGMGQPAGKQKAKAPKDFWEGYTFSELLRKPVFYMMIVGIFVSCVCIYFPFQTVIPHFQETGLTKQEAVMMNSILMIVLAAIKLVTGVLCDLIGAKKVTILCLVAQVGCLVVMATSTGLTSALIGVLLLALALPIAAILIPLLTAALFGYRAQSTYVGIFVALSSLANMAAGPIINSSYDRLGSYSPMFLIGAAITAGMIVLFLVSYILAAKDKKKLLQEQI